VNFFLIFSVFRPFATPSKCHPVRPAPPHSRRYATVNQKARPNTLTIQYIVLFSHRTVQLPVIHTYNALCT